MSGLIDAISSANSNPAVQAMIIRCAGNGFIAGADLRELSLPPAKPHLLDGIDHLLSSAKLVVAALQSSALTAPRALKAELLDEIATGDLDTAARAFALAKIKAPLRRTSVWSRPQANPILFTDFAARHARKLGNLAALRGNHYRHPRRLREALSASRYSRAQFVSCASRWPVAQGDAAFVLC